MNFESVFSLQLAKPFLVLRDATFSMRYHLVTAKICMAEMFFFVVVLIVLFRLKLEDTSYIQVERST